MSDSENVVNFRQRHRRLGTFSIAALMAVGIVIGPGGGRASTTTTCTQDDDSHCYALAFHDLTGTNDGAGFNGMSANIRTNCGSGPADSGMGLGDHLTNEIWFVSNHVDSAHAAYYTEAGIDTGHSDNGIFPHTAFLFWSDHRPNGGGAHNHFITDFEYTLGTYVNFQIDVGTTDGTQGIVYTLNGTSHVMGTSSGQFKGPAKLIEVGIETTMNDGWTNGSVSSLYYESLTNSLHQGWDTATGNAHISVPDGNLKDS